MRESKTRPLTALAPLAMLTIAALLAVPVLALAAQDQAASAAATQAPSHLHAGMHLQRLAQKLNLSEEQQASAKQLFSDLKAKMAPVHQAQQALHTQLKAALSAPNPDAATVGQLVISMHQNRAQMKPVIESLHQQFQALLNPDQLAQYKQMLAARSSFRHFRGGFDSDPTQ